MDNFYTDEPIDLTQGDENKHFGNDADDGDPHNWDFVEGADDEAADYWEAAAIAGADVPGADGALRGGNGDVPERIRQLLELIRRQPWQITMAKSFYEQATLMADYADSAAIVPYQEFFPTYRGMTLAQMRSYFTIRKMWREGKFPDVSMSYIFVYVYELLMQVGINTPEEGLEIMEELVAAYSPTFPRLNQYMLPWMRDYVVYYNLSEHFKELFAEENAQDELAARLADYAHLDAETLVKDVCSLSKYDIMAGVLFKKQPDKAMSCTADVLRELIPSLEKEAHHHFDTLCLGKKVKRQVTMFYNAVFYTPNPVRNAEILVAPRHRYVCLGGLWSKDGYVANTARVRSLLGTILREVDRQARAVLGVKPALRPNMTAKPYATAIARLIAKWHDNELRLERQREAERRRVRIDFGKLGKIRADADVVMAKLSEPAAEADPEAVMQAPEPAAPQQKNTASAPPPTEKASAPAHSAAPVNPTDTGASPKSSTAQPTQGGDPAVTFLRLFLSGGDWRQYLRDIHTPEGVMVEKINEKAMDSIGDIVLEDNGDGLQLIEDYRTDVEQMIAAGNPA